MKINSTFYTVLLAGLLLPILLNGQNKTEKVIQPNALCSNSIGKNNFISILDYGANPASGIQDDTERIQRAIDENPGRTIFFPAGFYRVTRDIIVKKSVELVGEGKNNTIFQPLDCNGFVITSGGVVIRNMFIYGAGTKSKTGIYCVGIRNTVLENLTIQNLTYGIELVNVWDTKIDKVDLQINRSQTPQIAQGIRLVGQCVNNHISNCHILANDFGIAIIKNGDSGAEGLMITNTLIASCKAGIYSEGIMSLHVSNCIIDLITEWALHLTNTRGLLLSNNWIYTQGDKTNPKDEAIHLESCWDCHISNNNIKSITSARAVSMIAYSNNNSITGNSIELGNLDGNHVVLDQSTSYNIIKDNSMRWSSTDKPRLVNQGKSNIIKDNLHVDN